MAKTQNSKKHRILILLTCTAMGSLYELPFACLVALVLSCALLYQYWVKKELIIVQNSVLPVVICMFISSVCSLPFAIDIGMGVYGVVRMLCVLLFALFSIQISNEEKEKIRQQFPLYASGVLLLSVLYVCLPITRGFALKAGRLGGVFGYANTLAIVLLLGLLAALSEDVRIEKWWIRIFYILFLSVGICFTRSKTTIVLTAIAYVNRLLSVLWRKKQIKQVKGVVLFIVFLVFVGGALSFGRSTFYGRLLYWQDFLPTMLTHPFGTGYLGFYYRQTAVQTGIYDTTFLHNGLLQLLSDYGYLAFGAGIYLLYDGIFGKKQKKLTRQMIAYLGFHICFDIDLEYLVIWLILFLLYDNGSKQIVLRNEAPKVGGRLAISGFLCIMAVFYGYFAVVGFGYNHYLGEKGLRLARKMYPYDTENKIDTLAKQTDLEKASSIAAEIYGQNKYVFLACDALAMDSASRGDFQNAIFYATRAMEIAPYRQEGYEYLLGYLQNGALQALQENDMELARQYVQQMKGIPSLMEDTMKKTSWLGRRIKEQPSLGLDAQTISYLESL